MEVSLDCVSVSCGVLLISSLMCCRSGDEGTVPLLADGGEGASGVSMHSSDSERSESKSVGLGAGDQPGGQLPRESTVKQGSVAKVEAADPELRSGRRVDRQKLNGGWPQRDVEGQGLQQSSDSKERWQGRPQADDRTRR